MRKPGPGRLKKEEEMKTNIQRLYYIMLLDIVNS